MERITQHHLKSPIHVSSMEGKRLAKIHAFSPYNYGRFIVVVKGNYYVAKHTLGDTILAHWKAIGEFPKIIL